MTRPAPLETALRLLTMGICVIPLKARDKRPALGSWKEFQTRRPSEAEVRSWFERHPDLNVGIVCGAVSGLVVIDADNAEMATRVALQHPSPMRTKTSKGAHFFYRHPGVTVSNKAKITGLQLDVRGDGGYVVAPGSVHPSGALYEEDGDWTADLPAFDPAWVGEAPAKIPKRDNLHDRITKYLASTPGATQGEAGDPHTFRVACKLVRGYNLSDSEALDFLTTWNAKCTPPWSAAELRVKVQSARTSGTGAFGYLLGAQSSRRPSFQPAGPAVSVDEGGQGSLQEVLAKTDKGAARKTPGNLAKILRLDDAWGPRLALNEMTREVLHDGIPQGDGFVDLVQEQIEDRFGVAFGREECAAKILAQATLHTVHPVREWLQTLPEWDGVERISKMADVILNSDGHPIYQHYLRCTLVGAVRRIFEPGTKFDTTTVLAGGQGFFKSTFWRELCGPQWFVDSYIDIDSKDGAMTLHRGWFVEMGEIDHLTSTRSAERTKGFMSSPVDTFRPPFARSVAVFPRSCVIVGTTNRERFLNDPTGSRRFWPIRILRPIDLAELTRQRLQLWAEALDLYANGVPHWLDTTQEALRIEQSQSFECEDPWESLLDLAVESFVKLGRPLSEGFSLAEILTQMDIPSTQQNRSSSMKLAEILRQKGWEKARSTSRDDRSWRWRPCPTSPTCAQPLW